MKAVFSDSSIKQILSFYVTIKFWIHEIVYDILKYLRHVIKIGEKKDKIIPRSVPIYILQCIQDKK